MQAPKTQTQFEEHPARGVVTREYCHFLAPMGVGNGAIRWYKVSSVGLTSKVA